MSTSKPVKAKEAVAPEQVDRKFQQVRAEYLEFKRNFGARLEKWQRNLVGHCAGSSRSAVFDALDTLRQDMAAVRITERHRILPQAKPTTDSSPGRVPGPPRYRRHQPDSHSIPIRSPFDSHSIPIRFPFDSHSIPIRFYSIPFVWTENAARALFSALGMGRNLIFAGSSDKTAA